MPGMLALRRGDMQFPPAAPSGVFVNDSFTGADGTNLTAHTGETGATWTAHTASGATIVLTSNRAGDGGNNAIYYASGLPATADYDVESLIYFVTNTASAHFICGRMDTTANTFYGMRWNQGTTAWQLYKRIAGTFTQLGSDYTDAVATGNTRTAKLQLRGTTITAFIDGTSRISVTDSAITAAGRVGFRGNGALSTSGGHNDWLTGTNA